MAVSNLKLQMGAFCQVVENSTGGFVSNGARYKPTGHQKFSVFSSFLVYQLDKSKEDGLRLLVKGSKSLISLMANVDIIITYNRLCHLQGDGVN